MTRAELDGYLKTGLIYLKIFHLCTGSSQLTNKYAFSNVVEAVTNPEVRMKWDKEMRQVKVGSQI
jgi:hypothetical protein